MLQRFHIKEPKKVTINVIPITALIVVALLQAFQAFWLNNQGYTAYLPKDIAVLAVEEMEEIYLYQDVFETAEYKALRKDLFDQRYINKYELKDFVYKVKEMAKDEYTYFYFDDYLRTERIDHYSKVTKLDDGFKEDVKNNKFGYIGFTHFGFDTGDEFIKALEKFKKEKLEYLIIDLRNNGGGYTDVAIQIADALLPKGQIMRSVALQSELINYSDEAYTSFDKIFVLLDKGSASCSEILPLALKENLGDKVYLIGTETVKKGVGQLVMNKARNHMFIQAVDHRWYVYDKDVNSLNEYLKAGNYNLKSEDDYFKTVYQLAQ